jgi:hypothetical protein
MPGPFLRGHVVPLLLFLVSSLVPLCAQPSYHDHASLGRRLAAIAREHPARVSVRSLATTGGGREIWCATIGGSGADARPAILVVGGIDGPRLVGSELALRLVALLASAGSDSARALLEGATVYVIPSASPDALESYFQRPRRESATNLTPVDDDRDGAVDEDGPDDLDGNELITQMRVRTPSGRWLVDPLDARLLREADASRGERGAYELLIEGRDDDHDGAQGEDGPGGVDINRNFTFNYQPFSAGAGEHAASEIETRALADFCYDHPNIAAIYSFSSQGNLVHPWEPRPEPGARIIRTVRPEDQATLARLSALYGELVGAKGAPAYVKGEGSFVEWGYYHFGRVSVGAPAWWMPLAGAAGAKGEREKGEGGEGASGKETGEAAKTKPPAMADSIAWLEAHGVEGAFVPWRRIEHPDFPGREVEVGGVASHVTSEPPATMLDSLAAPHARFVMALGALLPHLELVDVRTEALGEGLTRVRATVVNTGYLPTLLAMGATSRAPIDVKAELVLSPGQSVAAGRRVQLLGAIAGSGGSKELTWVVAGRGTLVLRVGGPMAGALEKTITLGR